MEPKWPEPAPVVRGRHLQHGRERMRDVDRIDVIRQMMGASHLFCTTVSELLERSLAESSQEQLVLSQVKLLLLIGRPGQRLKVTEVADFLGVTNAAASRSIDRLVQRGLVERTVSKEDRRAVDLALTEESRTLLGRFEEVRHRELLRLLDDFPTEKMRAAASLLDELSVRMAELAGGDEERCLRCAAHFREGCVMRDTLGRECVASSELHGPLRGREEEEGDELVSDAS